MASVWHYRPTSLVLPEAAAARVRARAATGPPVARQRRLRVAVRNAAEGGEGAAPVGALFLRWSGESSPVTVYYLGWNDDAGGTEDGMRRAAAQLGRAERSAAGT